jgi:hypothetical protein
MTTESTTLEPALGARGRIVPKGHIMIDRAQAEAAIYRIAFAALTFYPDKSEAEPGFTIDEDLEWALQPVLDLPPTEFDLVRDLARAAIAEPTAHREELARLLAKLAGEDDPDVP